MIQSGYGANVPRDMSLEGSPLKEHLQPTGAWTGEDAQLQVRGSLGLFEDELNIAARRLHVGCVQVHCR